MGHRFIRTGLALWLAAMAFNASAQDFPNRAITMVMPYAAGGPGDTITRVFAGAMQKHLGQQIVVDNRRIGIDWHCQGGPRQARWLHLADDPC
jgi:tripartite-type tricarboxylate transporter receptor subunit TctC